MKTPEQFEDDVSLRNTTGNIWEATIKLPVVGYVTTTGNGWEEAKTRLWLIACAVEVLSSKGVKPPIHWTVIDWKNIMKTMSQLSNK